MMEIFAPLTSEAIPLLQKVEIASSFQIPSFQIVGLPGPEVNEARERVRSAIEASGFEFPKRRIILNLSPAHLHKKGTGIDLAIALGILNHAKSNFQKLNSKNSSFNSFRIGAWGELGLDGSIKPIGQITRALYAAWRGNLNILFISKLDLPNAQQAFQLLSQSHEFSYPVPFPMGVSTLQKCWSFLKDPKLLSKQITLNSQQFEPNFDPLNSYVQHSRLKELKSEPLTSLMLLSPSLERTLSLTLAGGHHLLLLGPQGAGKSHVFDWLTELHPPASLAEQIQHQLLHELLRDSSAPSNMRRISPQVRPATLIGSTQRSTIRPGEYSMAHGGILMADEFLEWARDSRESLREPLERRKITLSRIQGCIELPASFLFVGNGNLCPCGGWPQTLPTQLRQTSSMRHSPCNCSYFLKNKYLSRLSGPILDRIDLVTLLLPQLSDSTQIQINSSHLNKLKEKIYHTQTRLIQNWGCLPGHLSSNALETIIKNQKKTSTYETIFKKFNFSSLRSRHKVIRIALSLAALDEQIEPQAGHWFEAQHFRADHLLKCRLNSTMKTQE